MRTQIYDKFEGGTFSKEGFGGGSFNVEISIKETISTEIIKKIHSIIDIFDHSTLIQEKDVNLVEKLSLRTVTVNKEVFEGMYATCLFNLISETISGTCLEYVKIYDNKKLGYLETEFDSSLVINLNYLRGK